MHGRPPGQGNERIATVGIYGIGMKRAIYKLGDEATVATQCKSLVCKVPFSKSWMSNDSWTLPLEGTDQKFDSDGTIVEVTSLRPEVRQAFGVGLKDFEKRLRDLISEHYAYIIGDGFSVSINKKKVEAKPIELSFQDANRNSTAMQPYFWQAEADGVSVFLAVGFYAEPPSKSEIDEDITEEENWKSGPHREGTVPGFMSMFTRVCTHASLWDLRQSPLHRRRASAAYRLPPPMAPQGYKPQHPSRACNRPWAHQQT